MSRYKHGLQVSIGLVADSFEGWTNVTSFDIVVDVVLQTRSIIFPADQLSYLVNTKIPCKKIIVVMTHHFGADDFWDIC